MTTDSPGAHAQLAQKVTKELYDEIKKLWIRHSKAEDARDLDGLIDTLAEGLHICNHPNRPTLGRPRGGA